VVILRSHIACAHFAVARPDIGERKESGGGWYTLANLKQNKLEWSVNGERNSGEFSSIVTQKYSEKSKVFNKYWWGKTGLKENQLLLFPSWILKYIMKCTVKFKPITKTCCKFFTECQFFCMLISFFCSPLLLISLSSSMSGKTSFKRRREEMTFLPFYLTLTVITFIALGSILFETFFR
jgi:hypothetical protein